MMNRRLMVAALAAAMLTACSSVSPLFEQKTAPTAPPPPLKIGLALGGGAAKGFAHVGVIKVLETAGIPVHIVTGTSAGSVVGALYAAGYDGFRLQTLAFGLDESKVRDLTFGSGGVVKGQKLEDYVNQLVHKRPIEKLAKPFGAVATDLDTGKRVLFQRGNTGQAVRASSSVPGVFEPVVIGKRRFVDGGLSSPVPVEAAREMGANVVIAVDISSKASHSRPDGALSILDQTFTIMGQKLGAQELNRADVVIRPAIAGIGAADFNQKHQAMLEGERAAKAALPEIQRKLAAWRGGGGQ